MGIKDGDDILAADFAGLIMMWGTNTAPNGWLICDGSAVSRTTYSVLFGIIGTTYGVGDGSTTFNLPNLKGKVVVGRDSGQTEFDTLAETGGAKTHTLSLAEMAAHTHTVSPSTADGGSGFDFAGGSALLDMANTMNTGSSGGGGAHNNLQPYVVLNFIICAATY